MLYVNFKDYSLNSLSKHSYDRYLKNKSYFVKLVEKDCRVNRIKSCINFNPFNNKKTTRFTIYYTHKIHGFIKHLSSIFFIAESL